MTVRIPAIMILASAAAAGEPSAERLKVRFRPLYKQFGRNSTTRVEVVSGPEPVKMRNGRVPGKRWIAKSGKYRFKLTIHDKTGFELERLVGVLEKLPGPYMRACTAVSDEGEDGIASHLLSELSIVI